MIERSVSMKHQVRLNVNGIDYDLLVVPQRTLLDSIRNDLGLTGTKKGCNTGECGTCTVIMDGKAINACLVLTVQAKGKKILTIEGLADGERLHALQEAFVNYGAVQCGYCTPGMIMSAKALLDKNSHPEEIEIKEALAGNLCRCTGYLSIIEAVKAVSKTNRSD
jgi:carbon-monoxide dehydrogenase small subunit